MSDIGPICSETNHHPFARAAMSVPRIPHEADRSDHQTGERPESPTDRHRRIESIRQAIAAGTYPNEDKLEVAMKRMIEELSD